VPHSNVGGALQDLIEIRFMAYFAVIGTLGEALIKEIGANIDETMVSTCHP
jgi:hypothetical protein